MRAPLRIAVADEHAAFRTGLIALLQLQTHVKVVAEIECWSDVAPAFEHTPCDILLLYLPLHREALADMRTIATRVPVIVITGSDWREDALAALRSGARGVVLRRLAIDSLVEAIGAVARGQVWIPPALQATVVGGYREHPDTPLTAREREIAAAVARGLRNIEVARQLFISEQTVKTHLNNIFHKLGVRDRVELAMYAARIGLVELHEEPDRSWLRAIETAA